MRLNLNFNLNLNRNTPGAVLLSRAAISSAALVAWNDLWLKHHHPGWISGKLSDLGLLVFLPLFLLAAIEWMGAKRSTRLDLAACGIAGFYFIAIKVWPVATHAHVAWLSFVMPRWHFRAVTDPTDLLCLPAILMAWRTMAAQHAQSQRTERSSAPLART